MSNDKIDSPRIVSHAIVLFLNIFQCVEAKYEYLFAFIQSIGQIMTKHIPIVSNRQVEHLNCIQRLMNDTIRPQWQTQHWNEQRRSIPTADAMNQHTGIIVLHIFETKFHIILCNCHQIPCFVFVPIDAIQLLCGCVWWNANFNIHVLLIPIEYQWIVWIIVITKRFEEFASRIRQRDYLKIRISIFFVDFFRWSDSGNSEKKNSNKFLLPKSNAHFTHFNPNFTFFFSTIKSIIVPTFSVFNSFMSWLRIWSNRGQSELLDLLPFSLLSPL